MSTALPQFALLLLLASALFGAEAGRRRRYFRREDRRHAAHWGHTGTAHAEALDAHRSRPVQALKPRLAAAGIATVDLSRADA